MNRCGTCAGTWATVPDSTGIPTPSTSSTAPGHDEICAGHRRSCQCTGVGAISLSGPGCPQPAGRNSLRRTQENDYVPQMDLILGLLLLIVVLAVQYDLMKRAMFSALEQHAKNMAIREGTYDPERWQG